MFLNFYNTHQKHKPKWNEKDLTVLVNRTESLDASGKLRHLLTPRGLDKSPLIDIVDDAGTCPTEPGSLPVRNQGLAGR